MKRLLSMWLPVVLTAAMLAAVGLIRREQLSEPEEALAYMADCRAAAETIPYTLPGGWLGVETEVPTVVDEILKPNVLVSRSYTNLTGTGRLGLLVVQVKDVQNLLGHYPPVCYPGRGWSDLGGEARNWSVAGLDIQGTAYRMIPPGGDADKPVHIYNFILRPDGQTGRNMDAVFAAGRTGESRYFGAGQVQVLFFGTMTNTQRDAAFAQVVSASMKSIDAILSGYTQ